MFQALALPSEEGLKLETSVLETLFGGKFTVSLSLLLSVCLSCVSTFIQLPVFLSVTHSALSFCPVTHTSVLPLP